MVTDPENGKEIGTLDIGMGDGIYRTRVENSLETIVRFSITMDILPITKYLEEAAEKLER